LIRANRKDANHWRLVAELRTLGASVQDTSRVGSGCPDVFVGYEGRWHAVEIKVPKKRRLEHSQIQWAASTRGCYHVIRLTTEVHEMIQDWADGKYETCK
jgi:tRNA U54 and U55 pseudouridine synthase Pus10